MPGESKKIKILILGANGQLARNTTRVFLDQTDAKLTLYLRRARRIKNPDPSRVTIVEGDVLDAGSLRTAMQCQDAVYAVNDRGTGTPYFRAKGTPVWGTTVSARSGGAGRGCTA
jgi:nucleoside-diphosphate-sugar epimerase